MSVINIISSLRIIGSVDSIRNFIFDNIQTDDPTEEDYQLWNCKNLLIKHKLIDENTSIPYTTAAILNIFNEYDKIMGIENPIDNPTYITTLVSFESPNESVINAIIAMSTIFTDLIIIGTVGDEYWDYNYGWIVIVYGKIIVNKPIDFHNLLFSKSEFLEKSQNIIHNELTVEALEDGDLKLKYNILEGIYKDLRKNQFMRVSNLRIEGSKLLFDTIDRSALNWYESSMFPNKINTGFVYYHNLNKYFGYSCKVGNKDIAKDFLGLKLKNFKFKQSYDICEEDYLNRIEYLGN